MQFRILHHRIQHLKHRRQHSTEFRSWSNNEPVNEARVAVMKARFERRFRQLVQQESIMYITRGGAKTSPPSLVQAFQLGKFRRAGLSFLLSQKKFQRSNAFTLVANQ